MQVRVRGWLRLQTSPFVQTQSSHRPLSPPPPPLCQEMIGYGGQKQFSTNPPPLHLNPTFLAPKINLTGLYFPPIPFYIEPEHIKMLVLLNSCFKGAVFNHFTLSAILLNYCFRIILLHVTFKNLYFFTQPHHFPG